MKPKSTSETSDHKTNVMEEYFSCPRSNLSFLNLTFSWEKLWSHVLVRLNVADRPNGALVMILTSVIKDLPSN